MNQKSEGIVLNYRSFQEADRLITIYSRDFGKVNCIAKGVKRPTSKKTGHLEPGTYCKLYIARGKNLDILTEVEMKRAFGVENVNNNRSNQVYHLLELVDYLTVANQKNKEIFYLLLNFLEMVENEENFPLLFCAFKIKLLSSLGFFSAHNLRETSTKRLLEEFEHEDLQILKNKLGKTGNYLKLLEFLDSIIEKITERRLKTNRFIHARI